ncbi:MAG: replication-relaxation family protein [Bauldia sp.]
MDISPESCQRRSRFRRQPTGKKLWTSPRDIEIFRLLRRYRYLPSNFLGEFVGGNPIRLKQRLGDLYHEGYLDRPPQQWQTLNARYRHATYELGRRGREALVAGGYAPAATLPVSGIFAHEAMVCSVIAALELGARLTPGTQFLAWEGLSLALRPAAPFTLEPMPINLSHQGQVLGFRLRPDGQPFALQRRLNDGRTRTLYFPGVEVDRHTEPLTVADLHRTSILRKILGYREIVATGAYQEHFGFSNMLVPIVTINAAHMEHIKQLILDVTGGKGASYLLLKTVPDFLHPDLALQPDAALFREPWQRAGYPPLDLERELRGTA